MMDKSAVEAIAELEDKNKTIEVGGRTFARRDFTPIQYIPRPEPLTGNTLVGLLRYIEANPDGSILADCMVRIVDHATVELVEKCKYDDLGRTVYYRAVLDQKLPVFPFDNFIDQEAFIIKARALFEQSDDLDSIIGLVSKVVAQDEITGVDTGLSQAVTVKKGVAGALTEGAVTKGIYELRPYRTFRDIPQPAARFILRLRANDGDVPKVALFDAEGGSWRYNAIQTIHSYLAESEIIKEAKLPVLA